MSDARGYRGELKLDNGDMLQVSNEFIWWLSGTTARMFRFFEREPFVVGEPARFRVHVFDSMGVGAEHGVEKWPEATGDDEEGLWFVVTTAPIAELREAANSKR